MLGARRPARFQFLPRRLPTPADWGIGVTVCVGAINGDDEIVTASDHMLSMSSGAFTAERAAIKEQNITHCWRVLFAAEDVGVIPGLLRRIRESVAWDEHVPVSRLRSTPA